MHEGTADGASPFDASGSALWLQAEGRENRPRGLIMRLRRKRFPPRLFATLACSAMGAAMLAPCDVSAAPAQAPTQSPNGQPRAEADHRETIVVTARKRAERVDEVPLSVTRVAGPLLEQRRLYRIDDLQQLAPGLNISYFNPRGNYVAIRGIGRNPASDGLEPAVGVFVDGVYLGRPGLAIFDLTDISDVQILRGPQGTLFGKNTTAGALVITTKAPAFAPEASVEATAGNNGFVQLRAAGSAGLIDDRLSAGFALYHTGQEGPVRRTDGGRVNGTNRSGGRFQLLFSPSDQLHLRLAADYHREDDSCCTLVAGSFGPPSATYLARVAAAGGVAMLGGREYRTAANAPIFTRVRQGGITANLTDDFGWAELTAITGYREWHYRAGFDGDLSSADAYASAAVPSDDWQFSQEVRLANHSGSRLDWTVGAYYFRQTLHSALRLAFGGRGANFLSNAASPPAVLLAFNNVTSSTGADLGTESMAAFGQINWHVTPRLGLTVGARGTYERKWGVIDRPANAAQPAYNRALSVNDTDPSGTLALAYAATPDLHLYASYARGAKAGGINPIVATSSDDQIVRPERTDSFELGLKSTMLSGRAHLNAAVFYARIDNYQATINRVFRAILTNVGKVSTRGGEVEADWRVTDHFGLAANGAYTDAHYDHYPDAPCPPETVGASCDLSGGPLADAPHWIVNLAARYHHRLGRLGEAAIAADYSYKSDSFGNIDNSRYARLPAVGIVNAQFELDLDKSATQILLWVKNLADVRALQSYPLGGATIYGAYFGTVTQPRSIGLTISRHL